MSITALSWRIFVPPVRSMRPVALGKLRNSPLSLTVKRLMVRLLEPVLTNVPSLLTDRLSSVLAVKGVFPPAAIPLSVNVPTALPFRMTESVLPASPWMPPMLTFTRTDVLVLETSRASSVV